MSLLSIHKEENVFNSVGDVRTEYVVRDHRGNTITTLDSKTSANKAMLMLCGGPGDLVFYDFHAQVWYPRSANRVH